MSGLTEGFKFSKEKVKFKIREGHASSSIHLMLDRRTKSVKNVEKLHSKCIKSSPTPCFVLKKTFEEDLEVRATCHVNTDTCTAWVQKQLFSLSILLPLPSPFTLPLCQDFFSFTEY